MNYGLPVDSGVRRNDGAGGRVAGATGAALITPYLPSKLAIWQPSRKITVMPAQILLTVIWDTHKLMKTVNLWVSQIYSRFHPPKPFDNPPSIQDTDITFGCPGRASNP